MSTEDPRIAHLRWRAERHERVAGPHGPLSLVETVWLPAGTPPVPDAEALRDHPDSATLTRLRRVEDGAEQIGHRVWDTDSDANRRFDRIEAFDYDPAWVLPARFEPAEDAAVELTHIADERTRSHGSPGDVVVTVAGAELRLAAIEAGDRLQLVFADETTGAETYAPGRFLFLQHPGGPADVTLDFNRAVLPPCAFSPHFNCPLPPAGHRLPAAVRAGEAVPSFIDG